MVASPADRSASPPLPGEATIDVDHLSRMTLGDRSLEREVLTLFDHQTELLVERMRADGSAVVSCAHTLKGSARNIGAWQVARAAERVEQTPATDVPGYQVAMAQLVAAVAEARRAIASRLD
jgi:HPt (histidine-containing phosphotransfer) domain-containing protein